MESSPIRALVADDSKVARQLMAHILESDARVRVIGSVEDGQAALEFVQDQRPDVVIMDIHMPRLDGFEATRRIMETQPVPIVICSASLDPRQVATTFKVLEAGAVACVEKPVAKGHSEYEALAANFLQTVRLMSEVKVIRRWPRSRTPANFEPAPAARPTTQGIQVIGVGASTGGPPVLQTILGALPKDFPVPVLIVQHIAKGFLPGLAEWLNQTTGWKIQIAAYGDTPQAGHAYLAPDDFHLGLSASGRILLSREEPVGGLRPAVAYLFRSLAQNFGSQAVGVLLTGMGRDGAEDLKLMRDSGAETIAQDRETSVVHGMPGEAIALGAASYIQPPEKIADTLVTLVKRRSASDKFTP